MAFIIFAFVAMAGIGVHSTQATHPDPLAARPQCPNHALPLPADALAGATRAVVAEAPRLYRGKDLRGMRVTSAQFEDTRRNGYARATCGKRAHRRTVIVWIRFPAERPSASLSQGRVAVSRFTDGYHVWAVLH